MSDRLVDTTGSTLSEAIERIVMEQIRPRTRVDGGDIGFVRLEGQVVHINAYADCASCPRCVPELTEWIRQGIAQELGVDVSVRITRRVPYYAR